MHKYDKELKQLTNLEEMHKDIKRSIARIKKDYRKQLIHTIIINTFQLLVIIFLVYSARINYFNKNYFNFILMNFLIFINLYTNFRLNKSFLGLRASIKALYNLEKDFIL